MFRTLTALRVVVLGGALIATATVGRAQPAPKTNAVPVITTLLPYIGGEDFQKELKLDADQTKKLLAHRQKVWDEVWTTAPNDTDFDARNKATATEFKAVLTPDQLKRANQLAVQLLWSGGRGGFGGPPGFNPGGAVPVAPDLRRVPVYLLQQYPEVADALKLDETQKKLGAAGGPGGRFAPTAYLTPEQSDRAKELLGEQYKGKFQQQSDTRTGGSRFGGFIGGGPGLGGFFGPGGYSNYPLQLQFTAAKDVQRELKLTDDQNKALDAVRAKWNRPTNRAEMQKISPADRKKTQDALLAETEKELEKVLSADQRKRLRQIERQQSDGPDPAFVAGGELAKELAVTEAQQTRYDAATDAHANAFTKAILSDEPFEKVMAAVEAAAKEREKSVEAILTDAQRGQLKELLGATFSGQLYGGPGGFPGNPNLIQQKLSFGRYSAQFNTLSRFKGVRDELKLTDEQVKTIQAALTEYRTKFPTNEMFQAMQDEKKGEKFFADRSAYVEKVLADTLTKEQQARFRELELQRLEAPSLGGFGPPVATTAASYPGVGEAIKLTAEQKKRLLDGEKPAEVLTADQKKAIAGMLGKPAKLAEVFDTSAIVGLPPGTGTPAPALTPAYQLLLNTLVWDAIKLTRDQSGKIATAANEYGLVASARRGGGGFDPGFPGGGGPVFQPADPKEVAAAVNAFTLVAEMTLTGEQRDRLDQLARQQALTIGLDVALLNNRAADLPAKLGLTDAQKKKMSALGAEAARRADLLDDASIPWEKETDVRQKLRDQLDARLMTELTADQRVTLKNLTGEPFPGFAKRPLFGRQGFGGGGFGGFGP